MSQVIPAILTSDRQEFEQLLDRLRGVGEWLQIDIMDGKFVSQASITLDDVAAVSIDHALDIHLMVENPRDYFSACQAVGARRVIFHQEVVINLEETIAAARVIGSEVGVALKPQTPIEVLADYFKAIDVVLLLGVEPGQQGQQFQMEVLEKIKSLRAMAPDIKIEIDGGVNKQNIQEIVQAGADYIVAGSAIVTAADPVFAYQELADLV